MPDVWFTPEDLEDILWASREEVERRLVQDGQILAEEAGQDWVVGFRYVERLVLATLGRLPDEAELPKDDAVRMLQRYVTTLVEKKKPNTWVTWNTAQFYGLVRRELREWEERVRPLLRRHTCITSFVPVR